MCIIRLRTFHHLDLSRWVIRFIPTPISASCSLLRVVLLLYVQLIYMINRLALRKADLSRIFMERLDGVCYIYALYSGYLCFKPLPKVMLDCHHLRGSSQGI